MSNDISNSDVMCTGLRARYQALVEGMIALNNKVDGKIKWMEEKERQHNEILAKVAKHKAAKHQKVELNVGGRIFATCKEVLLRGDGTYFHGLLCGGFWNPDKDGAFFIDRDPESFACILRFLRTGVPVDFTGLSVAQREELRADIDYYQLASKVTTVVHRTVLSRFDASRCSASLLITDDDCTATKTVGTTAWSTAVGKEADVPSFKVRIRNNPHHSGIGIGYVRSTTLFTPEKGGSWRRWTWTNSEPPNCPPFGPNDVITVFLNKALATISFEVNGQPSAVTLADINCDAPLFPCIELLNQGSRVSFED